MSHYLIFILLFIMLGGYTWVGYTAKPTYENMTVAGHTFDWARISLSVSAAFLIIPAFLQAGGFGYSLGVYGVITFVLAFGISLLIYQIVAVNIKKNYPDGVSLVDAAEKDIGPGVTNILKIQYFLAPIYHILVNLLGIKYILKSWSIDPTTTAIFTAVICIGVVVYLWRGGLYTSIKTDAYQLVAIILISTVFAFFAFTHFDLNNFITKVNQEPKIGLLTFPGLLFIFILTSSLMSNQEMISRVMACRDTITVRKTFLSSAIIVPLILLIFGFIGMFAVPGFTDRDMAIPSLIDKSDIFIQVMFLCTAIAIATSNIDSATTASALIISRNWLKKYSTTAFQMTLIVPVFIAWLISLLDLDLLLPLIIFSAYRTAMFPVIISIAYKIPVRDRYYLFSFILALVGGGLFGYYAFLNKLGPIGTVYGYIITLVISTIPLILFKDKKLTP